ncbi:glycosyl hydrolase [Ginsengibacter hankyongi]|uniref:Glycosyl hydrolase n=2 Tax=Ginsengibacter hankyongi TaxID=2607284 RepID=A0A5J5IJ35_9BACT|nr:glycosyl hydrolase [Ginsengibacter hankyongi]
MMFFNFKITKLRCAYKYAGFLFVSILTFLNTYSQVEPTKAMDRLNGLSQRKLLRSQSLLKNIKFRNIGPSVMSGRVVDVDVNPNDPTEFYVAYATGGLWHTTNNGQSFVPVFDHEAVIGIGDIAVNWHDGEIWVGTGEANSSRSSYSGIGVYKSIDTGRTWQYLGLPESQHIGKIILDPLDKNIAWVAVIGHLYSANKERGVYKTTDGGRTWKQTLYVDDNTGAIDMDINPKNPDELFACMWYRERRAWNFVESGNTSAIYKSVDGGDTWKKITGNNTGFPQDDGTGRIGIAMYAANPQIIYATLDNQNHRPDTATKKRDTSKYVLSDFKNITKEKFLSLNDKKLDTFFIENDFDKKYNDSTVKEMVRTGKIKPTTIYDYLNDANTEMFNTPVIGCEVYRSDDSGLSWKKVNANGLDLYNTYGYYFGKISVSPVNENKIIINGFNLMESNDGGRSFTAVDKFNTHPDWHGTWINPLRDSNWVAGNDGGCNITYDNGKHWFKANTPSVAQFYAIAVDNAKPYNVYGGIQDNGVWYGSSKLNDKEVREDDEESEPDNEWKNLGGGDGMQVQVDTRDNKTVYFGSQFGEYERKAIGGHISKRIHPLPDIEAEKLRYNWQTPILLSSFNQDILYMGSDIFYRSMNKGDKIAPLSKDLSKGTKTGDVPYGTIVTINESPLKFGLIYIGTDDGNIQVTKDGGYTWTLVSSKLPKNLYVSRVVASAFKEGRVYATLNGYRDDNFTPWLYVSEDYGQTWSRLGNNLPSGPLNVIREDPKFENILYVGSDNGLYASFDKGKTFMAFGNDLPPVPVHDIAVQKAANDIVIGTHGRSIYIASLNEVQKIYKDAVK